MRSWWVVIAVALTVTSVLGKPIDREVEVIRYARGIDVAKLDPTLSSQRLDTWLKSGPPHFDEVLWRTSRDCDLKEPAVDVAKGDWPLCVRFTFRRGSVGGWGMIRVGTRKNGIAGEPRLEYFTVMTKQPVAQNETKLSDLPHIVDAASKLSNSK